MVYLKQYNWNSAY